MRLRNVRNKESIMAVSNIIVWNPKDKIGHWQEEFQNENPIHVEVGIARCIFLPYGRKYWYDNGIAPNNRYTTSFCKLWR